MSEDTKQDARTAAWTALARAAVAFAGDGKSAVTAQALSDAAKEWAAASKPAKSASSGAVIPFGRSKGTAVADAETKDLRWVAGALRSSIDNPEKARFRDSNQALLDAIDAELETR